MTTAERERKLADIAALDEGELDGWEWAMKRTRSPFDGELAAIAKRRAQLHKEARK